MSRRGHDQSASPAASSGSELDSVSDSEESETAVANHSSESEADVDDDANLAAFYGKLDRVDDKEVTLTLHKRTIKLF